MSTILDQLHEAIGIHDELSEKDERKRVIGMLDDLKRDAIAEIEKSRLVARVVIHIEWVSDYEEQQSLPDFTPHQDC